jgi:lipopolysaccharide export system permease protein
MRWIPIPTYWRYVLLGYVRVLILSVATFLAVLIITRFKEIARFTALSGDWAKTALFTAYQFPLILPIAIPISALIASFILFQRLSRTHELMALRSCGFSLCSILAPLLFTSALFTVGNFSICAEIAPFCRRESKAMLYHETSANPLLLLQRQQLIRIKHAYLSMKVGQAGMSAQNVILIAHNESNKRLSLLLARELSVSKDTLLGKDVAILSHLDSQSKEEFDPLIIENQASMSTAAPILSDFLKKNRPRLEANALTLRMLILRTQLDEKKIASSALVEILRRFSLSLAVFSFTFLGSAYGIENGRTSSKRSLGIALILTLTVLISYLMGKELKAFPILATLAFLLSHPLIWFASAWRLRQIARGSVV